MRISERERRVLDAGTEQQQAGDSAVWTEARRLVEADVRRSDEAHPMHPTYPTHNSRPTVTIVNPPTPPRLRISDLASEEPVRLHQAGDHQVQELLGSFADRQRTRFMLMQQQQQLLRQQQQRHRADLHTEYMMSSGDDDDDEDDNPDEEQPRVGRNWIRFRRATPPPTAIRHHYGPAVLTASPLESAPGHDSSSDTEPAPAHFPSNDVDSYWYNQPSTTHQSETEDAPSDERARDRRSGIQPLQASEDLGLPGLPEALRAHPITRGDQYRAHAAAGTQLGPLPQIPQNGSIEESRLAMLAVLRAHRTFASGHNSDDSEDFDAYYANALSGRVDHGVQAAHQNVRALFGTQTSRLEKSESGEMESDSASARGRRRARRIRAQKEAGVKKWLVANTLERCSLDCFLLRPGMRFQGVQKITAQSNELFRASMLSAQFMPPDVEKWDVDVTIHTVDMRNSKLSGVMRATNIPRTPKSILTSWEGEIIDFQRFWPKTGKWKARCEDDTRNWSLFDPVAESPEVFLQKWPESLGGKRIPRMLEDFVFMRWKETEFINVEASETGLTIAGFYYICMNRRTGSIEGVYFDPLTPPYQRLFLKAENDGRFMSLSTVSTKKMGLCVIFLLQRPRSIKAWPTRPPTRGYLAAFSSHLFYISVAML
ncbi:hypothetical protein EC988_000845 [Linderina pennispora]|nr:hypothetical protein EC988_000845 [Linderina pennispora]